MNVKNQTCIRRLSFRTLWAARKRNVIATIAIALTTVLFTSLFTIAMSMNSSYQTYTFRQIGGYNHGTFKDVTDEQIAAISAHKNVNATGERTMIGTIANGVFSKIPAEVSFMDANCTKWSYAQPLVGNMPQSGKEITMDTKTLSLLEIEPEVGAQISLTYTVGDQNQISYEKSDIFTLVGWWEYDDISPVHLINVSKEYAASVEEEGILSGMEPFRTDLNVMMNTSFDIRGQMEQVDLDLGYDWESYDNADSVRIGVNWGYTSAQMSESMDAMAVISIIAFLILVIFTGYLIIYNIFQISVTGDIRFYGLLKTIGVTPRQLRRIIRQQALLLCMVGIPLGQLLGYAVGVVLTPVIIAKTTFGEDMTTISISPLIFIISALFALFTVLISCSRPGQIAAGVSPVEAAKYIDGQNIRKKSRTTRGAKVHQMAFANLGRNKRKSILVVVSLALSVVLLNILVTFVSGFHMERYLEKQICADFIVSSKDYFRSTYSDTYISEKMMEEIKEHTSQSFAGCGYTLTGVVSLGGMTEEIWKSRMKRYISDEDVDIQWAQLEKKNDLVSELIILEGLDDSLFEKLTVIEGDITPMFKQGSHAIALEVYVDDYGKVYEDELLPKVGDTIPVTYMREDDDCVDHIDLDYTVCAHVTIPSSMSYRYRIPGYSAVLPKKNLEHDSGHSATPMFYLFDTSDAVAEEEAERYLTGLTAGDLSDLMYESKATVRTEFEGFQNMFLLLGGVLCTIISLVGILNFINAIMTGILSRQREFAVLQAVGMTNRQLKSLLICEGFIYALGAAITAVILSALLGPLMGKILENMFWFFKAKFTLVPVLVTIPAFILLGVLLPSVMYGHTTKKSVVERLREAE